MIIKINLIAAGSIKKQERSELLVFAFLVMALVFMVLGARYVGEMNSYHQMQQRQQLAEQELSKLQSIVTQVDSLNAMKKNLETRKGVIQSLMVTRLIYPQFMEKMVLSLPVNIWFRSMTTQSQPDSSLQVLLDAESLDNYSIADLISVLSSDPDFANVELGQINSITANRVASSAFRLTFMHRKKSI